MKRHPRLQPLSREHYTALKLARDAERAALSGRREDFLAHGEAIRLAWKQALERHFAEEERELLPLLGPEGALLAQQTLDDHQALSALIAALAQPDAATLTAFAQRLTAHVRFEERVLFEALEPHLATSA